VTEAIWSASRWWRERLRRCWGIPLAIWANILRRCWHSNRSKHRRFEGGLGGVVGEGLGVVWIGVWCGLEDWIENLDGIVNGGSKVLSGATASSGCAKMNWERLWISYCLAEQRIFCYSFSQSTSYFNGTISSRNCRCPRKIARTARICAILDQPD